MRHVLHAPDLVTEGGHAYRAVGYPALVFPAKVSFDMDSSDSGLVYANLTPAEALTLAEALVKAARAALGV